VQTLGEVLLFLVEHGPGRTEVELAKAIFGPDGYQQQVNQDCRSLLVAGKVLRRGSGGHGDPFTHYLP
jgi:hypothetical protein